jgi:hypothetical protein
MIAATAESLRLKDGRVLWIERPASRSDRGVPRPWDGAEDLPAGRRAVVHQVHRVTDIRPNALPAGDPEDNSEWLEKVD